jgi:hypothetical protein
MGYSCHDPSLGLVTKTRAWKGVGWNCNPRVTFTLMGMQKNVRDWAHTLPSGSPFWEFESLSTWEWESLWSPKFSKSDVRGQNPLDWIFFIPIENILKLKCVKWASMIHLNTYNTSYGQKKGRESKCQFDFRPLKVYNRPKLCMCVQVACHMSLESSQQGLKLWFRTHLNQKISQEVMGLQSGGSPNFGNFGTFDLGVLGKMTFRCSPVANHR